MSAAALVLYTTHCSYCLIGFPAQPRAKSGANPNPLPISVFFARIPNFSHASIFVFPHGLIGFSAQPKTKCRILSSISGDSQN
jgi:hypothetical protein